MTTPNLKLNSRGFFVAGTDTGVGKTLVACALVRLLRSRQCDAVGFKPMATGAAQGRWADAEALHAASGHCEPLEALCPQRFVYPAAPTIAAGREGRRPDMELVRCAFKRLRAAHATVIVEGIGGLLVPLDEHSTVLDFALEVKLPIILVCRAGLGTINQTVLSLRELERSGGELSAVLLNVTSADDTDRVVETRGEIERLSGRRIELTLPYLAESSVTQAAACLEPQFAI